MSIPIMPILTTDGKDIFIANFIKFIDQSKGEDSFVKAITRQGAEITFDEAAADDLLDALAVAVSQADALQLPIVGIDNEVLILTNFALIEDQTVDDEIQTAVLTALDASEYVYKNAAAALIFARVDAYSQATEAILNHLILNKTSQINNQNN